MLACWRISNCFPCRTRNGFCCRADALPTHAQEQKNNKKKVIVVGSGWAGLGAAHHLSKQGHNVTLLEADSFPNSKNISTSSSDVGIHGFWYPYQNIFSLVDELGIKPFTNWTQSALYSPEGMEVEFPVFQDLLQLPTPLGSLLYTEYLRLPLVDRLTALPLMAAVIDFDNTDTAWRKYDSMTARELLKQFGSSERLYQDVFSPMLQVGLFAPPEQCSAAATLGLLYYFVLAHQRDFDVVWCRGTIREKVFEPWLDTIKANGCQFLEGRKVTDFKLNEETGCISEVVCGEEMYGADAIVLAVGISMLQEIIKNSSVLKTREEFLKVLNLNGVNVLTLKLRLDRKVNIPKASNVCFGFDDLSGWTFFDLNTIHDEYKDEPATVLQADFYHADQLMPLEDEQIVSKVMSYLSKCINGLADTTVLEKEIRIFPRSLTHYFPGSYKYMMRGSTSFPNLFMAGDWIINRHGSWSQEKAYVTGLEAANRVVDYLEEGNFAKIIAVEEDEFHIQALRSFNKSIDELLYHNLTRSHTQCQFRYG
ncbi:Amine oxidase [Macleaya cordata]|uniref:Amine oxidase n=1 Tax=Macleaya cordata TaxID=56857 RepID=A0A200QZP3_MACCD|nr:Amine oxidase [Macleaya cordata]